MAGIPGLGTVELVGGIAIGTGVGAAVGDVVLPKLQTFLNEQWQAHPDKPISAGAVAAIVAEDVRSLGWGTAEAERSGINSERLAALLGEALNAPGFPELLALWRRGLIGDGDFVHGLRKGKLEGRWDGPLEGLRQVLLAPAELANARQQGFVTPERQHAEAALQGIDADRAEIQFETVGLPPGAMDGLTMLRRGIISESTYREIVREGHTKTKYTDDLLALTRQVLSAADYAGLRLRGWITAQESYDGGKLTGYDKTEMDRLFLNRGRPATPRQVHLGYARGAKYIGEALTEDQAIARAVQQSDIRPEWESIEAENRWTYPSPFVLRGLTAAGAFTEAQTREILVESGWKPVYATAAAKFFAQGAKGKTKEETRAELADEYETGFISEAEYRATLTALGYVGAALELEVLHSAAAAVKVERGRVVTALHKLYVAHRLTLDQARADLAATGMQTEAVSRILPLWTLERDAARHELTNAQVKAAYKKALLTIDVAVSDLIARGYTDADARLYLAE